MKMEKKIHKTNVFAPRSVNEVTIEIICDVIVFMPDASFFVEIYNILATKYTRGILQ